MIELAVIIPTLEERPNVGPIVDRLRKCLEGVEWEVLFVDDDSTDGTAAECRRLSTMDPRVRVLRRVGRRGLASACIEGMMATSAPFLAVIDGDGQHDETILPRMLAECKRQNADVVVGSRNIDGGGMGEFAAERVRLSQFGQRLSRMICPQDMTDPMSGFFLIRRSFLEEVIYRVQAIGFKILVDLVSASPRPVKLVEVPYVFRNRMHGESKLDFTVGFEYLVLLVGKLVGHTIPLSFASFALVGAVGLMLYLAILGELFQTGRLPFLPAAMVATLVAMISNFFLNNVVTHRAYRLSGSAMFGGLLAFMLFSSVGGLANIAVSDLLIRHRIHWLAAGLMGILIGSVWNYSVTSVFIWHIGQRRRARSHLAAVSNTHEGAQEMEVPPSR